MKKALSAALVLSIGIILAVPSLREKAQSWWNVVHKSVGDMVGRGLNDLLVANATISIDESGRLVCNWKAAGVSGTELNTYYCAAKAAIAIFQCRISRESASPPITTSWGVTTWGDFPTGQSGQLTARFSPWVLLGSGSHVEGAFSLSRFSDSVQTNFEDGRPSNQIAWNVRAVASAESDRIEFSADMVKDEFSNDGRDTLPPAWSAARQEVTVVRMTAWCVRAGTDGGTIAKPESRLSIEVSEVVYPCQLRELAPLVGVRWCNVHLWTSTGILGDGEHEVTRGDVSAIPTCAEVIKLRPDNGLG